jgi:nucleoside-diphosphate-sugar epimerase
MHLILTGATGLVGSGVLAHILSLPAGQVTRLSILSRKPVAMAEGANNLNVKFIHHDDFSSYSPELLQELKGADGVVWALGISQNEVNKEDYVKLTKDYTLEAAKAFSGLSDNFKFVYVSGEGATLKPGMFTPLFGRVKGETEAALLEMGKKTPSLKVFSLRPGAVDPSAHPEVLKAVAAKLNQRPMWHKVGNRVLTPALRACYPDFVSPTKDLGRVLTDLAVGDGEPLEGRGIEGEGRTITNVGMRRLAGI